MIKFEKTEIHGLEPAIRGMRNPLNSWNRSDSRPGLYGDEFQYSPGYLIGPKDLDLAMKLAKAGPEHSKYRRMIVVWVDITAPTYVWHEIDTYKVGTVRNSCSFMHKGVSEPFTINDFSIGNDAIYAILGDLEKKRYILHFPYETDEFKIYTAENGRTYRVYRNGRVVREAFDYTDSYGTGRTRHFEEADPIMYQTNSGYCVIKLSGRGGGHMLLHRMVAELFCNKPDGATQVNHIDGDKGNNCAENLEWVTPKENVQKAHDLGLYENLNSLHRKYLVWKSTSRVITPDKRMGFSTDITSGLSINDLAKKYGVTYEQAANAKYTIEHSETEESFQEAYVWETVLSYLNGLRELYIETKDDKVFQDIRRLLPQSYNQKSTMMFNYEVLAKIYRERRNHRLDEWRAFCDWIKTLPYSEVITCD